MNTFEEFQTLATQVPLALRNNLDRVNLPVQGLQEEAGRIGVLIAQASASGRFHLTPEQQDKLRGALSEMLWYTALLCGEAGMTMQEVAANSLAQLQARARELDPDRR